VNTFFRMAVYLSFAMIVFNLVIAFIGTLGAFDVEGTPGIGTMDETDALSVVTGLDDPNMNGLWLLLTAVAGIGAAVLAIAFRTMTPVGLYLFSLVFWTSYTKANSILSTGGYMPPEFLAIFFIGMTFLFIAAAVGMITGSG